MPKKHDATVRRTASRARSSSPPPTPELIVTAKAAACSASSACALENRSHGTPSILPIPSSYALADRFLLATRFFFPISIGTISGASSSASHGLTGTPTFGCLYTNRFPS